MYGGGDRGGESRGEGAGGGGGCWAGCRRARRPASLCSAGRGGLSLLSLGLSAAPVPGAPPGAGVSRRGNNCPGALAQGHNPMEAEWVCDRRGERSEPGVLLVRWGPERGVYFARLGDGRCVFVGLRCIMACVWCV